MRRVVDQAMISPSELDQVMARVTSLTQNMQLMEERKFQDTSIVTYGHGIVARDVHVCFMK